MKKAFTLAEVLIVIGIIGVVSAMTIPGLINKYQKQALESQLKKSYSTLQQVIKLMMAEEGVGNYYDTQLEQYCRYGSGDLCRNTLNKYFKSPKMEYSGAGFTKTYHGLACGSYGQGFFEYKDCVTANYTLDYGPGTMVTLFNGSEIFININSHGNFRIDVNGIQKPNTENLDIFDVQVSDNGTLRFSYGLAERIIKDGWKMNYMK